MLDLYSDIGDERVGFILKTGELVEVKNVCGKPEDGFDVSGEDLIRLGPLAFATWHTHPGKDNNLSMGDYEAFLNWPELDHWIVGNDGARKYVVKDGDVLIAD